MAGVKGVVRKRKIRKSSEKTRLKNEGVENGPTMGKSTFLVVWLVASIMFGSYLSYSYITSPTSSVVIDNMHNIQQLKWTNSENNNLQNGRKILPDMKGPESIAVDDSGNWYTGLEDGRIMKITNGGKDNQKVTELTKSFDFSAGSGRTEKRLMGLRFLNSNLYFADAYQGIFRLDVQTKAWKKIVGYNAVVPHMVFTNDLTITADGKIMYFTDTSEKWDYKGAPYSIIEGECTGRLFRVDLTTERVDLIRSNLCFANGIELDPTETKLLVSENTYRRILVIDIQSGEVLKQILLPGGPDNIRRSRDGGYWAPIPILADWSMDIALPFPMIRDTLTGALSLEYIFKLLKMNQGSVVKINSRFEPEAIYYDLKGKICQAVSHVTELDNGQLLLGTVTSSGIAVLDALPPA